MPLDVKARTNAVCPSGAVNTLSADLVATWTRYSEVVGGLLETCVTRPCTYDLWSGETACIETGSQAWVAARYALSLSGAGVNLPLGRSR